MQLQENEALDTNVDISEKKTVRRTDSCSFKSQTSNEITKQWSLKHLKLILATSREFQNKID